MKNEMGYHRVVAYPAPIRRCFNSVAQHVPCNKPSPTRSHRQVNVHKSSVYAGHISRRKIALTLSRSIVSSSLMSSDERERSAYTQSPIRDQNGVVWEQTISASIAKSSSKSSDQTTARGGKGVVVYRPSKNGKGWEMVTPGDDDKSTYFSSLLANISSYTSKDMTNIQNLPFVHHFLPANYPQSVCPSYTTYTSYCFLGSIAGSSAMVLSTQALLVAVGVGTQSAAPMAAALNWVMKDGVGQLGGVIFASQLGKGGLDVRHWKSKLGLMQRAKGNFQTGTADSNPKRWRMVAAFALDFSTLLEICTPVLGSQWFLPLASIANVGKNIGFLAASASRAAIHQSLCMGGTTPSSNGSGASTKSSEKSKSAMNFNNNLGDVTAKAGSQAIVASLLGTALGILLSRTFCSDHGTAGILAGFVVLSAAHQVCTYKALRAVPLKSVDRHRLHILLDDYIKRNYEALVHDIQSTTDQFEVLTPIDVSEKDFFFPLMPPDDSVNWLTVGASLLEISANGSLELESLLISKSGGAANNSNCLGNQKYEQYIMKVNPNEGTVLLTFLEGALEDDILCGMFHAYMARTIMSRDASNDSSEFSVKANFQIITKAHSITTQHFPFFSNHLQKGGWEVGSGYVSVECGSSHRLGIDVACL